MNIRNHQWITHGVIVLAVLLAALFIVSPVHAEGEPPAQPAPSGEVTVSEPAQPAAEDKAEVAPAPATPEIAPTTADITPETALAPDTVPAVAEPVIVAAPSDVSAPAATELTAETPSTADLPKADVAAPVVAEEVKTPTTADIVQQASATNTLLVGEDGKPITLASAESVSALAAGDPYFTAAGITYRFLVDCAPYPNTATSICTQSPTPITAALNYIVNHSMLPGDRKVYVEGGTYNEDVSVDGTGLNSMLGLLNGLIGAGSDVTTVNGNMNINNTTIGFTLSGFTVNGSVDFHNNVGALTLSGSTVNGPVDFHNNVGALTLTDLDISNDSGDGLVVTAQKGSVTLKNVSSHDNAGRGALIQNNTTVIAPVTITSSSFDDNDTYFDEGSGPVYHAGLEVESKGIVTLDGVSASYNEGGGAYLGEFGSLVVKNSIFDGNNTVSDVFQGFGLAAVESDAAPVALDNVQTFHNTGLYTIFIVTKGNVLVSNAELRWNKNDGLFVNNCGGLATATASVINSTFFDNGYSGLVVYSKGNILLNTIDAEFNGHDGVYLDNCIWNNDTNLCDGSGTITLTSSVSGPDNELDNNGIYGFEAYSRNAVTLTNFHVYANQLGGIYIDNGEGNGFGGVTINVTMPNFQNDIDGYDMWLDFNVTQTGLCVYSKGAISVSMTRVYDNLLDGAELFNKMAAGAMPVTITKSSFGDNGQNGLLVWSKGTISLTDCPNFNGNDLNDGGYAGAVLINSWGSGDVIITNTTGNKTWFNENGDGLRVYSHGNITISNIGADNNTNWGAYLDNSDVPAKNITVTKDEFSLNDWDGMLAYARGNISLGIVSANNNGGTGALLDNCIYDDVSGKCLGTGSVIALNPLALNTFDENNGDGLDTWSNGSITVTNAEANFNGGFGAELLNSSSSGFPPVSVTNATFKFNDNIGLRILSKGAITLNGVQSDWNDLTFYYIEDPSGETVVDNLDTEAYQDEDEWVFTAPSSADITIGLDSLDFDAYLQVWSGGSLVAQDDNSGGGTNALLTFTPVAGQTYEIYVTANGGLGNGGYTLAVNDPTHTKVYSYASGALLENKLGNGTVTILNNPTRGFGGSFRNNTSGGLYINASGAVTLNNVWSCFNQLYGLRIFSKGSITWNNGSVDGNESYGARLDNSSSALPSGVSVSGVDLSGNFGGDGLYVLSKGAVTLANVDATSNSADASDPTWPAYGVRIYNNLGSLPMAVTISATAGKFCNFSYNQGYGLDIVSKGIVILTNIYGYSNGSVGADIDNTAGVNGSVTLTNAYFDENYTAGLVVHSNGPIIWNNGSANENQHSYGARLDNSSATLPSGVSVSGVDFNNNKGGDGLDVLSKGAVTLANVDATNNLADISDPTWPAYGVRIYNNLGSLPMAVTISATAGKFCNFNYNQGYGLDIGSRGIVSLTNINVIGNGSAGANIDNIAGVNAGVTLTNAYFDENYVVGLRVYSNGPIMWTNGNAFSNNTEGGVRLLNAGSSTAPGVTVSNVDCSFNQGGQGLFVMTKGAIVITNLTASNNMGIPSTYPPFSGAYLWNDLGTAPVTVTATAGKTCDFNNNAEYGLQIYSRGTVTLSGINTFGNGSGGADINNSGAATALPVSITNGNFSYNSGTGLRVLSRGNILLTNVSAEGNSLSYGHIDVSGETVHDHIANIQSPDVWWFYGNQNQEVTIELSGTGFLPTIELYSILGPAIAWDYNNGDDNVVTLHLDLPSDGNYYIVVSNKDHLGSGNYQLALNDPTYGNQTPEDMAFGAYLDNCLWNSGTNLCVGSGLVTITNTTLKNFDGNSAKGLAIYSQGAISVTNVNGRYNGDVGADIENSFAGSAPLTLTNAYFDENSAVGLLASSRGAITWSNGSANGNGFDPNASSLGGAGLLNFAAPSALGVTLSNVSCDNNQGDDGLFIFTKGAVLFTNVTASGNSAGNGAEIHNDAGSLPSAVTISAPVGKQGQFNLNKGMGLLITSKGAVTITNANAFANGSDAAAINNSSAATAQPVSLTNVFFTSNSGSGLVVLSKGNVSLTRITASFNNNNGIDVDTKGNITLTAIQAIYNRERGVTLNNDYPGFTGSILLLGAPGENQFLHNGDTGFYASAKLGITLNNLVADWNGSDGVFLTSSTAGAAINIFTASLRNNAYSGLGVFGNGTVTLNFVTSLRNGTDGVNLNSYGPLTILNSAFVGNVGNGIEAVPHGFSLVLTSTSYYGNDTDHSGDRNLYIH